MAATVAAAAAMSPLQAAEKHLGSIHTWPSSIIFSLFTDTQSPSVIEYLTDFFSGNALPKTLAFRLYSTCNPEAANELVRQLFYTRFSFGTPPTQSGDTSSIMIYVSRNLYVAMYHTYQSSPRKNLYQCLACRLHSSACKIHPRL